MTPPQVLVVDVDRGALLSEDEDNRDVIPKKLQKALCMALSLAKNMTGEWLCTPSGVPLCSRRELPTLPCVSDLSAGLQTPAC